MAHHNSEQSLPPTSGTAAWWSLFKMISLPLVYLLTYGGAVLALVRPYYGVLIYVAFSCLRPDGLWAYSVPRGNYSRIIAVALLMGWIINGFGSWRLHRASAVVWSLIAFFCCATISALAAPDQATAFAFLENMGKIVLPFFVGITLVETRAQLRQLIWVIVLSCGIFALECNLAYYKYNINIKADGFAGLGDVAVQIMMLIGAIIAFFTGIYAESISKRLLAFLCAAMMVHVVLFAMGRGGMLGLVVAGGLTAMLLPKTPKNLAWLVLAIIVGLRLAGATVVDRFMSIFVEESQLDYSAKSRYELWADAWDATLKRPLLGIGPDHFPLIAHEYGWTRGKEAHSTWLQLSAELGLPALIFIILFYWVTVFRLLPLARSRVGSDAYDRALPQMVIVAIVAFFVPTQFVSLEGLEIPYYVVLIGAGYLKLAHSNAPLATMTPIDSTPNSSALGSSGVAHSG